MDYMLAAHIRVMGGDAAVAEIHKVDRALEQVGKNTTSSGAGSGISAGMKAATQEAGKLQHAVGQVGDAAIRMATYMGLQTVVEGFSQAVAGVLDFDQAMTESLAIQQGVSGRMRGQMEDLAKSIAVDLGMAPKEAAEGFYFLASAGLNVEQQMAALPQVAAFAKAGMMELEEATEMAYDVLSALGLKVQDPVRQLENLALVTDVMTQAAIDSQGTVEQFAEALSNRAGGSIKAFGLDLEESVALLEVFSDQGIKGKVAGERFSMLIRDMALKSLKNADAWKAMGIEVYDAGGNMRGILPIMQEVDRALLPLSDVDRTKALTAMGFTLRDVQTILSVLGKSDDMARFTKQLDEAGGAAQRVAENQMESLRSKIDQIKSFTIVMAIEGFDKLQEAGAWLATTFAPAIDAIWDALANMGRGAAPVAAALLEIGGGAVVGALMGLADTLTTVFGFFAEHEAAARALGAALAALAGARVAGAIAGLVDTFGMALGGNIRAATTALYGFVAQLGFVAATQGSLAAVRLAISGIATALSSPIVVGAGVIYALSEAKTRAEGFKKAADEAVKAVTQPFDLTSYEGVTNAIKAAEVQVDILKKKVEDRPAPWENADQWKRDTVALKEMEAEVDRLKSTLGSVKWPFDTMFKEAGTDIFKGMLDILGSGIDPLNPKLDDLAGGLDAVGDAANQVKPTAFEEAMSVIGDAAANAEQKLEAFKTIMDTLAGPQSLFEAQTGFTKSLDELWGSLQEGGFIFDGVSEAALTNRDNLAAVATAARDVAKALEQESPGQGSAMLRGLQDQIEEVMGRLGNTPEEIQAILQQIGLSDAQIDVLINMTQQGPKPEEIKADLQTIDGSSADAMIVLETIGSVEAGAKIDETARPRIANVAIGTPGLPEAIGGVMELAADRTQTTTVDLPNQAEASLGLDWVARFRDQLTQASITNEGAASALLDWVARNRDSWITAYVNENGVESALNAMARVRNAVINVTQVVTSAISGNPQADGSVLEFYGGGGVRESHVAQYARAGAWRIWAEPETGGEAYIPLAQSKRARSMAIWEDVGRRFGIATTPGTGPTINLSAPISMEVNGTPGMDANALAAAAGHQAEVAVQRVMTRALVELRAAR